MLTPTHMLVALALAHIFKLPKLPAFLAALALDLDVILALTGLGFPFVHRGIIHTPLFIIALTVIWYYYGKKSGKNPKTGLSVGLGGISHIGLDLFTAGGVPLLFPIAAYIVIPAVNYANIVANAGIMVVSLLIIQLYYSFPKIMESGTKKGGYFRKPWHKMLMIFIIYVALIFVMIWIGGFYDMYVWDPIAGYY
jgi:membrane-bound metal-dependent hydrolase YbcI (DUF457 family)